MFIVTPEQAPKAGQVICIFRIPGIEQKIGLIGEANPGFSASMKILPMSMLLIFLFKFKKEPAYCKPILNV
jgi:hypothetical protein